MSAWPKLKNKKGALQKILWAELSVLLQKKGKMGVHRAEKIDFSFLLSFRTYSLYAKVGA